MLRSVFYCLVLVLSSAAFCNADLTLRYTVTLHAGAGMPALPVQFPKQQLIRIKGDKTSSTIGELTAIVDNATGTIKLLNPATKQYAQMSMADYFAALQPSITLPAEAQTAFQNMTFDVQNKSTGQMGMIAGIRAEEHALTMTMSMNMPGLSNLAGPLVRMEMHTWLASPDDLNRISGLREYSDYVQRALTVSNAADQTQKLFAQIPGMGEKLRAAIAELTDKSGSLTVKTQQKMYMPIMAQFQKNADPTAEPKEITLAMETSLDLTEISTASLDNAVFEVPADYQAVAGSEIVKALLPQFQAAKAAPAARPDLAPTEEIVRVGAGVSQPSVIHKQDPEYTKEATAARLSGTVALTVVIDKEGNARNIQVARPLGMGLEQKAVEAVSQWKFRPGTKDGQPVNVRATIEVNFRLLDPPQQ
jgi:TonB family protein